ncbi:MAG: ParB/RepB/Spo0J family partition protein [Cyanobacteria bacterium J069]|nr:MAG: ParB/RepB/Spo0J family partition protein [Cyanobacteria bacterium J069]
MAEKQAEKRVNRFKTLMAVIGNPSETELEDALLDDQDSAPELSTSEEAGQTIAGLPAGSPSSSNIPLSQPERQVPALQEPSLQSTPDILWIAHPKIHRDADQARRYFDPDELAKMARSMQAVGIIDPLSVRPSPRYPGEYDLLAGEKRHRAAEIARLAEVPCRVFEVSDDIAEDIKAISNLQRGDLNKWEETSAIMGMLCRNLQKSPEEVVSLLNRASNQRRGLTDNVVRSEEWVIVEDVFNLVGRLTPESFRKHRVPLLKLPRSIQDILQQGKLSYTKVNEVLKVKDPEQQRHLLHEAIAANLSVDSIQARVKELRQTQSQLQKVEITEPDRASARLSFVSKAIKRAKFWQDPQKSVRFQELLAEMERLIE